MTTKENFKQLLEKLNFQESLVNTIYTKKINNSELKVDFENEQLIYPKEIKVNDKTTSNFSHSENFVVFECVNRLLEKGYLPKHIELEPRWSLGHSQKSGKADIAIKDNENKTLCIIECKTAGSEFEKAIKLTELDGGQVFSYASNSGANYIALYASNKNGEFQYKLISLKDNETLLENNSKLKSYKKARSGIYGDTANALFRVWSETYKKSYIKGLFESDIEAYNLEKNKFNVNDLNSVNENDISKIYHQFATILRQHNISSRENAFDKLINLFLCKIVDEIDNKNELKFYWRGVAYDDEFSFVDRLQKLYKDGMKEFLNEKITYIENDEIDKYFKLFDVKTIKRKVKEAVKELKFFTSNDFAFVEVHNRELFYQNFEVLLKIVLLFQDIYLTNSDENQFLGDLFEGFLDQGIKQNEGQYFTPMPIVKFIINSLPEKEYKNAIDYACGAGHFLNEFAKSHKNAKAVGIEKEYRLSKVSKVSSFMYGNKNINIIYNDALKKDVVDEKFDLLISNPPYSVKGFLETLQEKDLEQFELSEMVDIKSYLTNNSIETFFIEKIKHLLNNGGIASIIIPISILDKTNSQIFIKTREIILKYFNLKAIVKLPSKTFGKTGTVTIILYLEKRDEKVDFANKLKDVVDKLFKNDFSLLNKFDYKDYFYQYSEFMGYDKDAYCDFIKGKYSKKLFENEIFKNYKENYKKQKNKLKVKKQKREKRKEIYKKFRKEFINEIKKLEKDRLYYFVASKVNGEVLVVLPPEKNNEIKKFLGYEWSSAKGNEGIKYISKKRVEGEDDTIVKISTLNSIETPLYNPSNFDDETKINKIIKNWLENKKPKIENEFVKVFSLTSMLDLKENEFKKVINLQGKTEEIEIKTQWDLVRLGDIAEIKKGTTITKETAKTGNIKVVAGGIDYAYFHNVANRPKNTITISASGNAGYVNFWKENIFASDCTTINHKDDILIKYIYIILKSIQNQIFNLAKGALQKHVYPDDIKNIKIPLPPFDIQKKIVEECEKIDNLSEKLKIENKKLSEEINDLFKNLEKNSKNKIKLSNDIFEVKIGKRVLNEEISQNPNDGIPVFSANVFEVFGYTKKELLKDFSKPSVLWGIDGDWMVNYIKENNPFYPTDHCGVLRILKENIIHYRYLGYVLHQKGLKSKFSRVKRASIERIKIIEIDYPDYTLQKQIVAKIETLEEQIQKNNLIINNSKIKKEEILEKYL